LLGITIAKLSTVLNLNPYSTTFLNYSTVQFDFSEYFKLAYANHTITHPITLSDGILFQI
jgi:hypothetical protein